MVQWKLAYHANCWGGLGGDAVGVTSITQLRYRTFGDMDRAFADIAAAGYAGVELFDGNLLDHSAAAMRKLTLSPPMRAAISSSTTSCPKNWPA